MDVLREWAVSFCAAALICGAVSTVSAGGRMEKSIKLVLALVMLCILVGPLRDIKACGVDASQLAASPLGTSEKLETVIDSQLKSATSQAVESLVERELRLLGCEVYDISAQTDISQDGCISIGQVTAVINESDEAQCRAAEKKLLDDLGIVANVTARGE